MITQLSWSLISIVFLLCLVKFIQGKPKEKVISTILFVVAIASILYFTMIRGARAGKGGISFSFPFPFYKAIKSGRYGLTTNRSVLNMLLFIPFGYLGTQLLTLSDKKNYLWIIAIYGFLTSFLIETCQLVFNRGVFELDDLIKNTMGAAMGWMIWKLMNRKR